MNKVKLISSLHLGNLSAIDGDEDDCIDKVSEQTYISEQEVEVVYTKQQVRLLKLKDRYKKIPSAKNNAKLQDHLQTMKLSRQFKKSIEKAKLWS